MYKKLILLAGMSLCAVGCGTNLQGTYVGTETVATNTAMMSGAPTNAARSVQVVMNNENSGNITGSWNSQDGAGTLTASVNGNSLTNVQMTMTSTASQGLGYPGYPGSSGLPGYPYPSQYPTTGTTATAAPTCVYTGSLTVQNKNMTGSLTAQNPTYCVSGVTTRSVNATNSN